MQRRRLFIPVLLIIILLFSSIPMVYAASVSVKYDKNTIKPFDISIDDSTDSVINKLGEPQRKDKSEYGFDWWIYNSDYNKYLQVGIDNNKVTGIYTNTVDLKWEDIYFGEKREDVEAAYGKGLDRILKGNIYYMLNNDEYVTLDAGNSYITVFFDKVKGNTVTSIQIIRKSYEENIGFFGLTDDSISRAFEMESIDLVNSVRVREGMEPLKWNAKAHNSAYGHSKDMAANYYFGHIDLQGKTPFDRMSDAGLEYYITAGENIAAGYRDAIFAHEGWMNSEGHRSNILNKDFKELGVGVYFGGHMQTYYTQNFITLQ